MSVGTPAMNLATDFNAMETDFNAMEFDENFEEHDRDTAAAAGDDTVDRNTHIPLRCLLCPKSSKFSDISHLLTHLSSKGHLANKFHLDIAKDTEEEAKAKLEAFQAWYDEHGIQELLRARNETRTQKQNRMSRAKPSKTLNGKTGSVGKAKPGGRQGTHGNARLGSQPEKATNEAVKDEPDEDTDAVSDMMSFSHGQSFYPWEGDAQGFNLPPYPGMSGHPQYYQQRSINHLANHPKFRESACSDDAEAADEKSQDEVSSVYGDVRFEPADGSSTLPSDNTMETTAVGSPGPAISEEAHNAKFRKGEWLQGMEVFDSASTEARRKRNQRKDPSILAKMLKSSLLVEQIETVTDLNFVLHKERNVYDEPSIDGSEDDDVQQESTKKKKTRGSRVSRGGIGKPRGRPIKTELSEEKDFESISGNRGGRNGRSSMRGRRSKRASSREESPRQTASIPRLRRSGRVHARGSRQEDVFRDLETPARGSNGDIVSHRRDGLPELGLALRPGNPNVALLSPTPMHKVHSPRLYGGKENSAFVFPHTLTTSNPFLDAHAAPASSSYNPLCVQPRDDTVFNAFSPYDEDTKPFMSGFHPINNHASYDNALHLPSRTGSAGFQQDFRHGGYGI